MESSTSSHASIEEAGGGNDGPAIAPVVQFKCGQSPLIRGRRLNIEGAITRVDGHECRQWSKGCRKSIVGLAFAEEAQLHIQAISRPPPSRDTASEAGVRTLIADIGTRHTQKRVAHRGAAGIRVGARQVAGVVITKNHNAQSELIRNDDEVCNGAGTKIRTAAKGATGVSRKLK